MSAPTRPLTVTQWLVITIAAIGFLFDTYELLMTPLVAAPAIAELLRVPMNNPLVTDWVGRLLWIAAVCGGTFGTMRPKSTRANRQNRRKCGQCVDHVIPLRW